MEAECDDYLDPLSNNLDGRMGIVISNWDNKDGRSDFEFNDAPSPSSRCGSWDLSSLSINTADSNEECRNCDQEEEEEEEDDSVEPAEFQGFLGNIDWNDSLELDVTEFWVKGLDG